MTWYLKKNWKKVSLACAAILISEAVLVLAQLVMMQSFDAAVHLDARRFLVWTAGLGGVYLACNVLDALRCVLQARAQRALNNDLRRDLCLTLLSKTHADYHSRDTGEYLSWLTNNVKQIENLAWTPFFNCVSQAASVVWSVLALLSLSWELLAVGLFSSAVMMVIPKLFQKRMERLGETCAAAEAQGVSELKDLLSGFDVLRFFGQQARFLRRGDTVSDSMEAPSCRRAEAQAGAGCVTDSLTLALQILQMTVTAFLVFQGKIIIGAMASATNLTGSIANGLSGIARVRLSFAGARPYFANVTVHAGAQSAREADGLSPVRDAITVEGLTFRYGEKDVLQNAAFRFERGGKYALTGPSGCGKSTLLKLLLGWLPDYEGTISFDGQDAKSYTPEQLQTQMSYIEQDVFLFNTTIRENITLGEEFTEEQLQKALRDSALAGDLANMPLGLDTPVGEEGSALSGGQKQRVAIARALIHDRSILLVDEGTSALDQKNADIVEKSLLDNPDLTLILVSHHLGEERQKQFTQVYDLAA